MSTTAPDVHPSTLLPIIAAARPWLKALLVEAFTEAIATARPVASEELLTAEEAARYLRVSVTALNKHGRDGDIPRVYHGRTVRYRKRDLDTSLAAGGIPLKPRPLAAP